MVVFEQQRQWDGGCFAAEAALSEVHDAMHEVREECRACCGFAPAHCDALLHAPGVRAATAIIGTHMAHTCAACAKDAGALWLSRLHEAAFAARMC